MFLDNIALTWMLVILNVTFFFSAFAGLVFASIAASDMLKAKHARKDAEKLFAEQSTIARPKSARETFKPPYNQEN